MTNRGKNLLVAAVTGLLTGFVVSWVHDMLKEDVSDYVEKHRATNEPEIPLTQEEEGYTDLEEEPKEDKVTISKGEYGFLQYCRKEYNKLIKERDMIVYYGCPSSDRVKGLNWNKLFKS